MHRIVLRHEQNGGAISLQTASSIRRRRSCTTTTTVSSFILHLERNTQLRFAHFAVVIDESTRARNSRVGEQKPFLVGVQVDGEPRVVADVAERVLLRGVEVDHALDELAGGGGLDLASEVGAVDDLLRVVVLGEGVLAGEDHEEDDAEVEDVALRSVGEEIDLLDVVGGARDLAGVGNGDGIAGVVEGIVVVVVVVFVTCCCGSSSSERVGIIISVIVRSCCKNRCRRTCCR